MASDGQGRADGECIFSSGDTDTSKKLTTASDEHCSDDEQRDICRAEIDIIASDNITKSSEGAMARGRTVIAYNEFSTKTWKNDLTVTVEGNHLNVSSSVLALISPVFSSMLEEVFKEEGPRILELTDNYDDFLEFLRCIYPGIRKPVTEENALNIVSLAHKYRVEIIEETCTNIMLYMVNGRSTLEYITSILNTALACQLGSLRDKCITEMTRRKVPDSKLNQLTLSPKIRYELKKAKVRSLEEEVQSLRQSLQEKSDRCNDFEYIVSNTWIKDLEIKHTTGVELHVMSVDVSENGEHNAVPVCLKNTTWTLKAELSDKPNKYSKGTSKELSVVLSAQGDMSWTQWKCKVKASCIILSDGKRLSKQISAGLGSSISQLSFLFSNNEMALNLNKKMKVSVIFAVGDLTV